jgi:hypothetical protein
VWGPRVDQMQEGIVSHARYFGRSSGRVWGYAFRECLSVFASSQPKLSEDYADFAGFGKDN